MIEEWRDIEGYEGKYQVSNTGFVRCIRRGKVDRSGKFYFIDCNQILKGNPNTKNYLCVRLYKKEGGNEYKPIHRLVAKTFIENPDNKPFIDHINRNKHDNSITNLRWVTSEENMRNKSDNLLLEYNGITKTAVEWSEITGLKIGTIANRIKKGWQPSEVINTPLCKNGYDADLKKKRLKRGMNTNGR